MEELPIEIDKNTHSQPVGGQKISSNQDVRSAWNDLHEALEEADRIVLSTHENPDGDGLGSQIALYLHLKEHGKDVRILNCTPAGPLYAYLEEIGRIEVYEGDQDEEWIGGCDLAVIFDVGDFKRLRIVGEVLESHGIPIGTVDHHPQTGYDITSGEMPFTYMIVDYTAPSTGTLVWQYLREYRRNPMSYNMAVALYTALVTDTGSFKYDNTDERAHVMAVEMLRIGIRPYAIHKVLYERRSPAHARLLGRLISNIKYSDDGQVGWAVLTHDDLEATDAKPEDVDGFSEFIRTINGVEVSALITEVTPELSKVSFRSKGAVAVNGVAKELGGGGHALACGAQIEKPWAEVEKLVTSKLVELVRSEKN